MGLATGGLPAAAAHGNRTVVVVTTPAGELVWTSWELGDAYSPWIGVPISGPARTTDAAPAVSFRTSASGYSVWLAIKGADNFIYETLEASGGFVDWSQIPGLQTNVSPAASDGNLAIGIPFVVALAAPPDDRLRINPFLITEPPDPPPPNYWQDIVPYTFTALAPAVALVDHGNYIFVATSSVNFAGPHDLVILNQGNPYNPSAFVGFQQMNFSSNVAPAMASANDRTVIVAVDPDGTMFYNWWDLGGGGHGWVPLGDDVRTEVAPTVAVVDNGQYMFVIARGSDNEMKVNQGTVGGAIIGWQEMD
jgi:hypothetical protein